MRASTTSRPSTIWRIEAVAVHRDILDLVKLAKEWTLSGQGKTNIALGPVLEVWHRCRTEGIADPENARLLLRRN